MTLSYRTTSKRKRLFRAVAHFAKTVYMLFLRVKMVNSESVKTIVIIDTARRVRIALFSAVFIKLRIHLMCSDAEV